jgi:flagellar biosynthetic protein FlhB
MVVLFSSNMMNWLQMEIKEGLSCQNGVFTDTQTFLHFIHRKIFNLAFIIIPILVMLFVGSVTACIAIGGLNFTPSALELKFNRLNPVTGAAKLIDSRSLLKLLVSTLKLLFVSLVVWLYLNSRLDVLAQLRWASSRQILVLIAEIILGLMIRVGIVLLVIALADALYQKWKYKQDLKMTRQEVKQERKDTEGSPEVKSRIRRIQFGMAAKRILQEVPKASVVLVNPTHVAVVLRYEAKTMDAPVMVAKGADHLAERIREIARAYGIPIIQRPELARAIYSTVKLGDPIPEALYVAVAEVLAMIYRLRHRK